jgi:hypothetical protein
VRRGAARASVRQRTGLARCTGSYRSAAATPVCGPACEGKTPLGLGATLRCLMVSPKGMAARPQLGRSLPAARFYGSDSNRTSTRSDRILDSPKQGKEWPLAGHRRTTARRRSTASRCRKVSCAAEAFARARAHGGVRMSGAYACETSEAKGLEDRGVYPLPGRARQFGHGGARVGADGRQKEDKAHAAGGDVRTYEAASEVMAHRKP